MATFFTRLLGLLMLVLAISVSSCQAVFPLDAAPGAPQQLTPGPPADGR